MPIISTLLRWEGFAFVLLLGALLVSRLLNGQIRLDGLLQRKDDAGGSSPERVQLLLTTLALSGAYFRNAMHSRGGSLPEVSSQMLIVVGASSTVYASVKAWTTLRSR